MKPRSRSLKLSIVEKAATLESNGFLHKSKALTDWFGGFLIKPTATKGYWVSFSILFKRHVNPSMVDHSLNQHRLVCVLEVDAEKFDFLRKTRALSDGFL